MELGFSLSDLHHFLAIKLCWPIFLAGAFFIWYKWPKPWLFLLWTGFMCGLAYYLLVDDLGLMFWGLRGDEITLAAMFEAFAHGGFFRDFGYNHLPPFYPPLFFWLFAVFGKMANWHGIHIAKFASLMSITLFPIIAYFFQQLFFHVQHKKNNEVRHILPGSVAMMLAPLMAWLFIDWDAMILKPYELISAFLVFIWMSSLIVTILHNRLTGKWGIVYAVMGGLLFMTYYLWLVFAYLGAAIFALTVPKKDMWRFYAQLGVIGLGILVVASPYLVPLVHSYQLYGSENWQVALITAKGIALDLPMFHALSWRSVFMLASLVSLIWYAWGNIYVRALASFFIAAYVWYIMGLSTAFFFDAPIQEFKGFYFFSNTILALAFAFGLEQAWNMLKNSSTKPKYVRETIVLVGLLFLSSQLIFGFFVDFPAIQRQRIVSRSSRQTIELLVNFLRQDKKQQQGIATLHSGISELNTNMVMHNIIYFNQHNSHPAAGFSERKANLITVANARSAKEFYTLSTHTWFGESIDRFIFYKHPDPTTYPIYLFIDIYPNGGKDETILIKNELIQEPYFSNVYENQEFIVFDRNAVE